MQIEYPDREPLGIEVRHIPVGGTFLSSTPETSYKKDIFMVLRIKTPIDRISSVRLCDGAVITFSEQSIVEKCDAILTVKYEGASS